MNITPLQAIERLIASGNDTWEMIVELANSSENDIAARRWLLGDLGLLVRKEYGKNRLADFATKANIARSTMNQYKNMSDFYTSDTRYQFENLSYAHFRAAMRLKDDALVFLVEASNKQWTVEQSQLEVKKRVGIPTPPIKLLDVEGCIERVDMLKGTILISLADGWDISMLDGIQGHEVKVKIFELEGQ